MLSFVNWQQQLALLVVAPTAWWVGSVVSSAAYDASKLAQVPTPTKLEAEANKPDTAQKKKWSTWAKVGVFTLIMAAVILIEGGIMLGFQFLYKRFDAANVMSGAIIFISLLFGNAWGAQSAFYLGWTPLMVGRTQDGQLFWKHKTISHAKKLIFIIPGVAACAFSLFNPTTIFSAICLTFFPIAGLSTVVVGGEPSKKPMALRWKFFGFMIMEAVVIVIFAICFGIAMAPGVEKGLTKFGKAVDGITGEKKEGVSSEMDPKMLIGVMFIQSVFTASFMGPLIAAIFRFDVALGRKKGTVRDLVPVKQIGEEIKGVKGAVTGDSVIVPSLHTALTTTQHTGCFITAPIRLYSVAAVLATIALTFTVPQVLVHIVTNTSAQFATTAPKTEDIAGMIQIGQVLAIYLAPTAITMSVGVLAYFKGEFKALWNYREMWGSEEKADLAAGGDDEAVVEGLLAGDELRTKVEVSLIA